MPIVFEPDGNIYCVYIILYIIYYSYPSFASITVLTMIRRENGWGYARGGFKIQLLSFLKNEPAIRNFYFFFSGLITSTGRKLDRETEAEHILEVILYVYNYHVECTSNYIILYNNHKTYENTICWLCLHIIIPNAAAV